MDADFLQARIDVLQAEVDRLTAERDAARAWGALWKRAAKRLWSEDVTDCNKIMRLFADDDARDDPPLGWTPEVAHGR